MKWNLLSEKKPRSNCYCYTWEDSRNNECYLCYYDKKKDQFLYWDAGRGRRAPISVTHWIRMPKSPWIPYEHRI